MGIRLEIQDKTSIGEIISTSKLEFLVECITVKQLIEARVTQEVERYNLKTDGQFCGFVQPTESERLLNGYGLKKGRLIDVEKQKTAAIKAFEKSGYFLLVNDRQLTDLDDQIMITPTTLVVFLKLVQLAGG